MSMKAHVRTAALLVLVASMPLTSQFSLHPMSILEAAKGRRGQCVDPSASPRRGGLGRRARPGSPLLMCGGASADGKKGEVYDFVTNKPNSLNGAIAEHSGMPFKDAADLVDLGAVLTYDEAKGAWERAYSQAAVSPGTRIKCYSKPRRFPSCHVDWQQRVLHMDSMYVVVDKPADLPCQNVESNGMETAPNCAEKYLQVGRLRLAHRLDQCVEGALVLARSDRSLREFGRIVRDGGEIQKLYRAVCVGKVERGKMVHYMSDADPRGPRLVRNEALGGWKQCVMHIVDCRPVDGDLLSAEFRGKEGLHEVCIRLMTGRRHQIRAQLAAAGAPVWGDTLYEPMSGLTVDFDDKMEEEEALEIERRLDEAMEKCHPPARRIALQSWRVEFEGIKVDAGEAWWERED